MSTPLTRFAVGCMTGTSLDGLDVALARLTGRGRDLTARFIAHHSQPLPDHLRTTLHSFAVGQPHPPIDYLRAARELGALHATAVAELCQQHLPSDAALAFVAAHGQTICHAPAERLSWQLFDPWPIVRKLDVPVVYDMRQADLIADGEGAPITPIADWVMYRDPEQPRFIVNLGGVCNITTLPVDAAPDHVAGGDVGLCNLLIDGVVQRLFPDKRYDHNGELAAAGRPVQLTDDLWHEALAEADARTLGREQLQPHDIDRLLDRLRPDHSPQDIIATMVDTVAMTVALHTSDVDQPWQIVLAGGGARNPVLVERIRDHVDPAHEVLLTDELGIPSEAREAIAFAVLGGLCEDGLPITLPSVTGSTRPGVAGTWAGVR
ncbi:anhydro-N-acetylmuramic acid kinase [Phycisphaerales bacterium AB-hyl4]|uniref:Anhydro-N-acetylmuramic acid kinase n=1 Tax=Natronomicrosphaera hydrolytica TaxID=3242702 RepID=A0ABV4U1V9_9BACT